MESHHQGAPMRGDPMLLRRRALIGKPMGFFAVGICEFHPHHKRPRAGGVAFGVWCAADACWDPRCDLAISQGAPSGVLSLTVLAIGQRVAADFGAVAGGEFHE